MSTTWPVEAVPGSVATTSTTYQTGTTSSVAPSDHLGASASDLDDVDEDADIDTLATRNMP